jgi:hypothetical protein
MRTTTDTFDVGSADAANLVTEFDARSKALKKPERYGRGDWFHAAGNACMVIGLVTAPAARRGCGYSAQDQASSAITPRVIKGRIPADVMIGQVSITDTDGMITYIIFESKHGRVILHGASSCVVGRDPWRETCNMICALVGYHDTRAH